jgi:site-specific DNA-methyltransferase (adenine-specific)
LRRTPLKIHEVEVTDIVILPNRQRREFDADAILELAGSISENGLIHPVVVRSDDEGQMILVAGERRLKAIEYAWEFGDNEEDVEGINCGDHFFPRPLVPCIYLGELDPLQAKEVELEENVRRTDLSWQEVSSARAELMNLRNAQAERDGTPPPTLTDIVKEVSDAADPSAVISQVKQDIILARHLSDPEIASAPSREKAFKALKRKEERQRNEALGAALDSSTLLSMHQLLKGDCTQILPQMPAGQFDVILTDPPYGIGADEFGDSGGRAVGAHAYDDSPETWVKLVTCLAWEGFRVTKTEAHAYVFCDIDRFISLRVLFIQAGWRVFRTPLVWVNPGAMRAPWPEHGPQRKYQLILFAIKGNKPVTKLYGDVIQCPTDPNLGHPAQKPVALLNDLLRRSSRPGDSILDPFVGSGSLYPACHEAKCKATGIEMDEGACGIASKRLEELK